MLDIANLTNEQKQIVKATVSKMDYQIMKDQLSTSLVQLLAIKNTILNQKPKLKKLMYSTLQTEFRTNIVITKSKEEETAVEISKIFRIEGIKI